MAARARYRDTAMSPIAAALHVLPNATITVFLPSTDTPFASPIYADATSGTVKGNPFLTDEYGNFEFFLPLAQRVKIRATSGARTITWDLEPVHGDPAEVVTLDGAQTLTNKALTSPTVMGGTITDATIVDPTVTGGTIDGAVISGGTISGAEILDAALASLTLPGDLDVGGTATFSGPVVFEEPLPDVEILVNVKNFETTPNTVGCGKVGPDDSAAIEAAIAELIARQQAMLAIAGDGRWSRLHFPAGYYRVLRPIDLTGLVGTQITGDGNQATLIGVAAYGASTPAYWANKPVMDITGGNFLHLKDFTIEVNPGSTQPCPEVGLLCAASAGPGGAGLTATNANYFEMIRVSGSFLKAAHVNYAGPSSCYIRCDFNRVKSQTPGYVNGNSHHEAALVLTIDNEIGVHGAPGARAPIATGAGSVSDIAFYECEIHDGCEVPPAQCVCPALWIQGGFDLAFRDGNVSGHGASYVRLSPGGSHSMMNMTWDHMHMYPAESGAAVTQFGFKITSNLGHTQSTLRSRVENYPDYSTVYNDGTPGNLPNASGHGIVAAGVTIRDCEVFLAENGGIVGGGRWDGTGGHPVNLVRWRMENVNTKSIGAGGVRINQDHTFLFGGGDSCILWDCHLECGNQPAQLGASGYVHRGVLDRPATWTPGYGTATVLYGGMHPATTGAGPQVAGWASIAADGTLLAGYNATSSRIAAGQYQITWARDFVSTSYSVVAIVQFNSVGSMASLVNAQEQVAARTAGQCQIICNRLSDGAAVDSQISVIALGAQA